MKKSLCIALWAISTTYAFAQDADYYKNPYEIQDSLFSQLDLSMIHTDLLLDISIPFIKVRGFDGQAGSDTMRNFYAFNDIYNTLQHSELSANAGPPSGDGWEPGMESQVKSGIIPFRSLHYNYHASIENQTQLEQCIHWDGQYFQYTQPMPYDPWEERTAFAAGPARHIFKDNLTVNFIVKSEYFFTNTGKTVSSVEIDFGNGAGHQTVPFDEAFEVTWPDTGTYIIEWKTIYTDASEYISHSRLLFQTTKKAVMADPAYGGEPDDSTYITASNNMGLKILMEYACGNDKLMKPLIYVEGWNPSSPLSDNPNDRSLRIDNFWKKINDYELKFPDVDSNHPHIYDNLKDEGYDIVYIDFDEGAGDIVGNAQVLKEALKWINEEKARNGSTAPNIVWGESMGGLVSRVALREMEIEGKDHDCKYYVSFDNAHLGVNLPYGYQRMVSFFRIFAHDLCGNATLRNQAKDFTDAAYGLLAKPASKQMLIYNVTSGINYRNPPEHEAFINYLNQIGLPQNTLENLAISHGNNNNTYQGFSGGDQILNLDVNSFSAGSALSAAIDGLDLTGLESVLLGVAALTVAGTFIDVDIDVYAMPDYPSSGKVFEGEIKFVSLKLMLPVTASGSSTVSSVYCYDKAAGSNINLNAMGGNIADALNQQLLPLGSDITIEPVFGFVPIGSSLYLKNLYAGNNDAVDPEVYGSASFFKSESQFSEVHYYNASDYLNSDQPDANNELHTTFTASNVDLMDNRMFNSLNSINTQPTNNLDETFNFGENIDANGTSVRTTDKIYRSLTVKDGGKLCVNCNAPLANGDQSEPNPNTSHFDVTLKGNCAEPHISEVVIEDGGIVQIGYNGVNTGTLSIGPNCVLRVESGGLVEVNDNSSLVVADNSNFIFEEGATIELPGYGSVIKFNGKVTIGDDADFTISGLGKLIFDQNIQFTGTNNDIPLSGEYWDIGTNATFTLSGPGTPLNFDHNLLESYKPLYLTDGTNTFSEVILENGRIALHEGALLFTYGPASVERVKVESAYSWQTHGGIRFIHSGNDVNIFLSKFINGSPGVVIHCLGGASPVSVVGSEFIDCSPGLAVLDGPFSVHTCNFVNGGGLEGHDITGQSYLNNSNFTYNGIGTSITSSTGASVNVSGCNYSHVDFGLVFNGAQVRSVCSKYLDASTWAIAYSNGALDIGEEAKNEFVSNANDIHFDGEGSVTGIIMQDGYNNFEAKSSSYFYVFGSVDNDPPLNQSSLNVDNNKLPKPAGSAIPILITYEGNTVPISITNNLSSVQNCGGGGAGTGQSPTYSAISNFGPGGNINTETYTSTTLQDAALDAIADITIDEEDIRDDGAAVMKLTDILAANVTSPDTYTEGIRSMLYMQMHKALNNAYGFGMMANSENQEEEVNDTVEAVIDILDDYLQVYNPNDSSTFNAKFRYTLDKTHVYRLGGYYDEALSLFNSVSYWTFNYAQEQRAGYWECACEVEKDYFEEVISVEEYITEKEGCRLEYEGYTYKNGVASVPEQSLHLPLAVSHLYPMPVQKVLNLELNKEYEGFTSYRITDIAGRLIYASSCQWKGNEMSFDVEKLITGIYFITIDFSEEPKTVRFVKQ